MIYARVRRSFSTVKGTSDQVPIAESVENLNKYSSLLFKSSTNSYKREFFGKKIKKGYPDQYLTLIKE